MATVNRLMHCRPEAVLAVLANGWAYATWVVGTSRIRGVDPLWPAPGSRIAHSAGIWPVMLNDTTSSLEWDPSRGIELQARGWPAGEARVRIEVEPRPGGACLVRLTEDAVRGPGKALPKPLRTALIEPRNRETLRRLAMMAEARSAADTDPPTR